MTTEQILSTLNWRYATKQFDASRKIPEALWQTLEKSLVLAPSSFGLQPWKFFVVDNPELRQQIQAEANGQSQVVDASHLVVLAFQKGIDAGDVDAYIDRMATVRQVSPDQLEGLAGMVKGFLNQRPSEAIEVWAARQVYIALGFFLYSAALLEIDTCPMEGFNPAGVDALLGLPDLGYGAVALCPAGYRSPEDKYAQLAKVRYKLEEVVQHIA